MKDYFEQICKIKEVSRETYKELQIYADEIMKWNPHINLISKKNVDDIWQRHIIDSVQLIKYIDNDAKKLIDFGSGGGLPAIVLGIIGNFDEVHMVESDSRKCAFLNEIATKIDCKLVIHNQRIEQLESFETDVITARALAPLDKLINILEGFINKTNNALFLKGENINNEINLANKAWNIDYKLHKSLTADNARIMQINSITKK